MSRILWALGWIGLSVNLVNGKIDREAIVQVFNVNRNHTNYDTPLQIGNGNFAFGADVTGLQSIRAFETLSDWAWLDDHTFPLVEKLKDQTQHNVYQESIGSTQQPALKLGNREPLKSSQINLGRVGFLWDGKPIQEVEIQTPVQTLNLSDGQLLSRFSIYGISVELETVASPSVDAISFQVRSEAMMNGSLNIYLDFPQFGLVAPSNLSDSTSATNQTDMQIWGQRAQIRRSLPGLTYYTNVKWLSERPGNNFSKPIDQFDRYVLNFTEATILEMTVRFSPTPDSAVPSYEEVKNESAMWWKQFWTNGAFVDCSSTEDPRAIELQRRTILAQYLMAVNVAGTEISYDTGLAKRVSSARPGMDTALWDFAHWGRWSRWERMGSAIPLVYNRLLKKARQRASDTGFKGAAWQMNTNSTHSSDTPESKSSHLWQQAQPFYFAELEYAAFPNNKTLQKWQHILEETTDYMTSYVQRNSSTSTNTKDFPEIRSSTSDLAYWRFGLAVAQKWYTRQNNPGPERVTTVYNSLASFPTMNSTYVTYTGGTDRPDASISTLFGLLPPDPSLNMTIYKNTLTDIERTFNSTTAPMIHFPLLAMAALRMGDANKAIHLLTHPDFKFDDAGYPLDNRPAGAMPYFPAAGGLLLAVAMLADGWTGMNGNKWPQGWVCEFEGFTMGI